MSNTKGSMLISNANAVGTELVNQLGGTGYTPAEWADAINLLGISDDDKASALAGITEGTYTGTERGAIKYSNCNAVGSMLNKKFSTDRGFKPVEWESAISKLTPLAEGTVSGAICNIVNGADRVPLKNWQVTLPASLDGYSAIVCTKSGKNLIKPDKYQTAANNLALGQNDGSSFGTFLKAGTYTISYTTTGETCYIYRREENDASNTNMGKRLNATFTLESDGNFRFWLYGDGAVSANISNVQIEVGSTATSYEAYTAPTTATASLGRTIYGGTADIVTGEGEVQFAYHKLTSDDTMYLYNSANGFLVNTSSFAEGEMVALSNSGGLCNAFDTVTTSTNTGVRFGMSNNSNIYFVQVQSIMGSTLQDIKDYIDSHDIYVVYRLATPTPFTFTPITPTPETELGVNNFWADNGDSTITYRKDPDIPDPPVQLLNMNNNNEDNNEGV